MNIFVIKLATNSRLPPYFQLATKVTTFFIEQFGIRELFGRENYEYYARLTGRILRVEDEWIFFTYPPQIGGSGPSGTVPGGTGGGPNLSQQVSRDDMDASLDCLTSNVERGSSSGGLGALEKTGSLEIIPENCTLDPQVWKIKNENVNFRFNGESLVAKNRLRTTQMQFKSMHGFSAKSFSALEIVLKLRN